MPDIYPNEIHVYYDAAAGYWRARDLRGDYGISRSRHIAVSTALDASATAYRGKARVVVHRKRGGVLLTITAVRRKPTAQFFQDSVP